jgi:formylmethanofuran dehydrogenase subunit E
MLCDKCEKIFSAMDSWKKGKYICPFCKKEIGKDLL